jgi:acyl-CoA reductase-like NAD-dependent aldehyde dehydrogenase
VRIRTGVWIVNCHANKTRRGLGEAVKFAEGFEPGAVIGPLIDMKAVEKVEARNFSKSNTHAWAASTGETGDGSFFEPTVPTEIAGAEQLH